MPIAPSDTVEEGWKLSKTRVVVVSPNKKKVVQKCDGKYKEDDRKRERGGKDESESGGGVV